MSGELIGGKFFFRREDYTSSLFVAEVTTRANKACASVPGEGRKKKTVCLEVLVVFVFNSRHITAHFTSALIGIRVSWFVL